MLPVDRVPARYKNQQFGSIDSHHPREQAAVLVGAGARAVAAQQNAWEALAVFASSVMVSHLAGAEPGGAALASIVFVCARVCHAFAYVGNAAPLRSLSFAAGIACCLRLFWLSAAA